MQIKNSVVILFALATVVTGLAFTFKVGFKLGSLRASVVQDLMIARNLLIEARQPENHRVVSRLGESLKRDHWQLVQVVSLGSLDRFLLEDGQIRDGLARFDKMMVELDGLIENGENK